MKIFKISTDSSENGYVYASGYGPIERMPFLSQNILERHKLFWELNPMAPGIQLEKGRKQIWPDFLHNGFSPPMFFVHERVVDDLIRINVLIKRLTEMPIGLIHGNWHKKNPAPKYFVVEVDTGIEIDFKESGYKFDHNDNLILPALYRPAFSKDVFKKNSWNGCHLFSQKYFGIMGSLPFSLFCTEKVKNLAVDRKWTNVEFMEVEMI